MRRPRTVCSFAIVFTLVVSCSNIAQGENSHCSITAFTCKTGECIPKSWRCDGTPDCQDHSDEDPDQCPERSCKQGEFQCGDGKCIPHRWQCDGQVDCLDKSDEDSKSCDDLECEADEFKCHNKGNLSNCISLNWVCDGSADCDDKSDEASCSKGLH